MYSATSPVSREQIMTLFIVLNYARPTDGWFCNAHTDVYVHGPVRQCNYRYDLMHTTWIINPEDRPTFEQIVCSLSQLCPQPSPQTDNLLGVGEAYCREQRDKGSLTTEKRRGRSYTLRTPRPTDCAITQKGAFS